ncbi:sortase family protein [Streptomyces sp. 840.1]|uniref:class F sortase n=1 Tax=Streptomyces sp. 840.1 TaxID=2485152 RepID=UPI000F46480D|nr:class F sortase [Streptomyces sp. 840.1]ROQ59895.1 sortase family protein [Streptomyces sp. 840.1]
MSRTPQFLRRTALPVYACLALTALTSLTGCSDASPAKSPARSAGSSATTGSPSPGPATASGPSSPSGSEAGSTSAKPASPPVRVSIPSLGIDSAVMRLGLNADGTVEVPPADKGMTVGWYTGGSVPGRPGPAVLIGHNDTRFGRAVFHDLKKIAKGADIAVRDKRGTEIHFQVTGRETASKKAFPTSRVYGRTEARALRLITCDGAFDAAGHPVDNLIVYAERK